MLKSCWLAFLLFQAAPTPSSDAYHSAAMAFAMTYYTGWQADSLPAGSHLTDCLVPLNESYHHTSYKTSTRSMHAKRATMFALLHVNSSITSIIQQQLTRQTYGQMSIDIYSILYSEKNTANIDQQHNPGFRIVLLYYFYVWEAWWGSCWDWAVPIPRLVGTPIRPGSWIAGWMGRQWQPSAQIAQEGEMPCVKFLKLLGIEK